jgi:hypothetical protein
MIDPKSGTCSCDGPMGEGERCPNPPTWQVEHSFLRRPLHFCDRCLDDFNHAARHWSGMPRLTRLAGDGP